MSPYKPMATYAGSERHYTAAGGDVQVSRAGIYVWRKTEPQEIDIRIGNDNAVLRQLYRSLDTKRELSSTLKLSVFKSIFVLILTCGHEAWVMTERITRVQTPKLGFLRRVHGVTKGRTEVGLLQVQETSLAIPCLNLSFFGMKCLALKKKLATLLQLSAASSDSASGALLPLFISLVRHLATKCAAVKFAVPWMSNHFS